MRFLDLSRATEGRESCSQVLADDEWQRRLTVDPNALVYGGLDAIGAHLAQESFHPRRPAAEAGALRRRVPARRRGAGGAGGGGRAAARDGERPGGARAVGGLRRPRT